MASFEITPQVLDVLRDASTCATEGVTESGICTMDIARELNCHERVARSIVRELLESKRAIPVRVTRADMWGVQRKIRGIQLVEGDAP